MAHINQLYTELNGLCLAYVCEKKGIDGVVSIKRIECLCQNHNSIFVFHFHFHITPNTNVNDGVAI